mmetsp:Transcript_64607/g.152814  ORF Transcript_64607/g.152814 Transcript_64607/m.152814 type:complete len:142 (+) Transcript_64607:47-472(+)
MEYVELLFWFPSLMDLLLLISIYPQFLFKGVGYFFDAQPTPIKMGDFDPSAKQAVMAVWELAMMAYSAYAVLLPTAIWWCYWNVDHRPLFCFAMTVLMMMKVAYILRQSPEERIGGKLGSVLGCSLPTYGGYVLVKTFTSF